MPRMSTSPPRNFRTFRRVKLDCFTQRGKAVVSPVIELCGQGRIADSSCNQDVIIGKPYGDGFNVRGIRVTSGPEFAICRIVQLRAANELIRVLFHTPTADDENATVRQNHGRAILSGLPHTAGRPARAPAPRPPGGRARCWRSRWFVAWVNASPGLPDRAAPLMGRGPVGTQTIICKSQVRLGGAGADANKGAADPSAAPSRYLTRLPLAP
jgi:hypothetical protein